MQKPGVLSSISTMMMVPEPKHVGIYYVMKKGIDKVCYYAMIYHSVVLLLIFNILRGYVCA
jgi:hypothetical protein